METIRILYQTRNINPINKQYFSDTPTKTINTNYNTLRNALENFPETFPEIQFFSQTKLVDGSKFSEYTIKKSGKDMYRKELEVWGKYILNEEKKTVSLTINSRNPKKVFDTAKKIGLKTPSELEVRLGLKK
jgi:hypothetical protein